MLHDKVEALKTYFVGITAITVPWLVQINPVLQFVSLVLGIYLVIKRIAHEHRDKG